MLDVGFKCFDPLEEVWIFDLPLDCVTVLGVELMMRLCLSLSSVSVWVFFSPLFSPVWGISLVVLGFHPEDIVPSLAVDLVCLMERDEFRSLPCCHCKLELSCIILVKWPEALWAKFYVPRLMVARWRFTENLPKLLPGFFTLRSEVKLNSTSLKRCLAWVFERSTYTLKQIRQCFLVTHRCVPSVRIVVELKTSS